MFKNILLATDGSPSAGEAALVALQLAQQLGSRVVVVYAFPAVPRYLGEPHAGDLLAKHLEEGERIVEPVARRLEAAGLRCITEVLEGPAAEAILRVADVRTCDLIIVGNRGQGRLAGLVLGSVSHRVATHARAPVLIVKANRED